MKDCCENIRKSQYCNNFIVFPDHQGLMVSHDQHMNGPVQGRTDINEFTFAELGHEVLDLGLAGFLADVFQGAVQKAVLVL